ncbi:MAG: AmmeMemoRadiSam system protein B [Nanobdellota archaeon]
MMKRPLIVSFILVAVVLSLPLLFPNEEDVRKDRFSGRFYPSLGLADKVDSLLEGRTDNEVRALIVPHAGYAYSGDVAGKGFSRISGDYDRVILIATNHNAEASFRGISVSNKSAYETPLGNVKLSSLSRNLREHDLFTHDERAHRSHVIEVELPFLQRKLDDFSIVPMITSRLDRGEIEEAAKIIEEHLDENTLLVVSSDLSHYHTYSEARELDMTCIDTLLNETPIKCEACGIYAIKIIDRIAEQRGWSPELIDYHNSGDVAGKMSSVVGYASLSYKQEKDLGKLEQIARDRLRSLFSESSYEPENISKKMKEERGCFVTLYKNGRLRGCTGDLYPENELYRCVLENAKNAALHDKRFDDLEESELDDIEIEISILTKPKGVDKHGEELLDHLNESHGVILERGFSSATYLPSVWDKMDDGETFLSRLCTKGNMEEDCWKDPDTDVYLYTAEMV